MHPGGSSGYQTVSVDNDMRLEAEGGIGQGHQLIQYPCSTTGDPSEMWLPAWEQPLSS